MSLKGSKTTASALKWAEAQSLILKLERDKKVTFALLIAAGIYTGLRIGDLLTLTWDHLTSEVIELKEKKTGKYRKITVNPALNDIAARNRGLKTGLVFIGYKGKPLTIQYVNVALDQIAKKYGVKGNFSTHSLRKSFGRHVWEVNGESDKSLVILSEILNHQSIATTKIYLGIRDKEIQDVYKAL